MTYIGYVGLNEIMDIKSKALYNKEILEKALWMRQI